MLAVEALKLRDRDGETSEPGLELPGVGVEDGHDGGPVLGDEGLDTKSETRVLGRKDVQCEQCDQIRRNVATWAIFLGQG